jgi:hypothetical protein
MLAVREVSMGRPGFFDLNRRYESLNEKERSAGSDCSDGSLRILPAEAEGGAVSSRRKSG